MVTNKCKYISNINSMFQVLLSGNPKGSILGPLLSNILTIDYFVLTKSCDLFNSADDNTVPGLKESI